jgi:hypothetical protein
MKKFSIIAGLLIVLSFSAHATLQITVDTDKDVYQVGENISIYITVCNSSEENITLTFDTTKQATYIMDEKFDYSSIKTYLLIPTKDQNLPREQFIWTFINYKNASATYPVGQGTHSIVGEIIGYGKSIPAQFTVIPEPATLSILCLGLIFARHYK